MICPRCGRQLLDTATYCPDCGAPISNANSDLDDLSVLSALDFNLDDLGGETQFMDAQGEPDLSEFDDLGVVEGLSDPADFAFAPSKAVAQAAAQEEAHEEALRAAQEAQALQAAQEAEALQAELESEPEPEPEPPLVVDVPPMSYETEVYQPVYPSGTPAYTALPYTQNDPDDEPYDDESFDEDSYNAAYDNAEYGYVSNEPFDVIYAVPETVVPTTYANVKPIAGGVPTEHYLSRRRRRRRKLISFIILLLLLIAAAGAAWYTWDQEMWGGKRVPALVGMTEEAARSALTVKGLTAEVSPVPADAGFGVVLGTEPAEGERSATDTPVVLQVASPRTIPDVVGKMADDARAMLADEGATNIILTYANSSADEGTVIGIDPAPSTAFISTDPITITIAQPYTVPEVVGKTITDAQAAVAAAGLKSQVEYYNSWATRDTIIYVTPEAGTRVDENATVTLYAPVPYPSTVYELGYYYRITPEQVSDYLNYLNYTLEQGGTYTTGEGYERWTGATGDIISFTNEPESSTGPIGTKDVLAEGAKWTAVRYQCAKGSTAAKLEVSEDNARLIAKACGLGGDVVDSCDQNTIITPYAINRNAYDFNCIQGEWGDYVWVVLISRGKSVTNTKVTPSTKVDQVVSEDGTVTQVTTTTNVTTTTTTPADTESTVIVALMPKETTNVSGLAGYANSFCDYFAYANLYSSNR